MRCLSALSLLMVVTLCSACTGSGYKLPEVSAQEYTEMESKIQADETEMRIYKRSDKDYRNRLAKISKRLQNSAKPLCEQAEYSPCRFEVNYNNEMIVNAYAHEHYKITVYKGMLQYLSNNEEIAGLVAHEMGHHLSKHNQESLQNAQTGAAVAGVLTAVLVAASNAQNPYYNQYQQAQNQRTIENMMEVGAKIGAVSYSKEQEREADLLAVYLLKHARYDLNKAQGLMYKLARMPHDHVEVDGKAALLDTHPPSSKRYVAWSKAIDEIKANETGLPYLVDSEQVQQEMVD